MAILMRFTPEGMTSAQYNDVLSKLEAAGAGSPPGRIFHAAFGDPNNLHVSDIWDSRESFAKFSETLKPIMESVGIAGGEPAFIEVRNMIMGEGARTAAN